MAGTRWVRLDVDYFGNIKTLRAGLQGRALHIASICYVARHLTDGAIPDEAIGQILGDAGVPRRAVSSVVNAGLWVPSIGGSGFVLHDYLTINPSRAEVERDREGWRDRQRRFRESRRQSAEE